MNVLRCGTALCVAVLLGGCAEERAPVERTEQAAIIAAVFETAEPYSARTLDSTDLGKFFERHPNFRDDSTRMAEFYARRNMQFAWFVRDSLTELATAFLSLGDLSAFGDSLRRAVCDSCASQIELRLSAEFFGFAERNYNGHFSGDPRELDWFIPRAKKDIAQFMDSLAAGTMDLAAYEPLHPQYVLLRNGLRQLSALSGVPWPEIALAAGTRSLKAGDTAAVVALIRERLRQLSDLQLTSTSPVVDSGLVVAVQSFQARHGLASDGVMGPAFLRALNVSPTVRMRTILVNMERLRWAPEQQPSNALIVNIPDFRLLVFEDDLEVMNMRIVVGADATGTVIFSSTLQTIVMSPTWTLPQSITRNEILPAIAKDPAYLRKHNMEIIGGSTELPVIRQRPGANNALGRVKFVFPNSYSIYMHDTPAQGLFAREQRAFSHGCIRLSEPRDLAEYLLRDNNEWPPERIGRAMMSGRETSVELTNPRPVLIVYFTSWVNREGQLEFRDDVYGHDKRLAAELFR